MSAPLVTRDALAEVIETSGAVDTRDHALLAADALLASGALTDATKLAADEALVERIEYLTGILGDQPDVRDYLTALAAALSAQSERAEVCHCGMPVTFGYDGDPTHHRGMCKGCDAVRCDAYPGACCERAEVER